VAGRAGYALPVRPVPVDHVEADGVGPRGRHRTRRVQDPASPTSLDAINASTIRAMSERIVLSAGPAEVVVDPAAGGRIAALRVGGLDVLVADGPGPLAWGCYPMAPWAGRIRDGVLRWRGEEHRFPAHLLPPHAIHGTLLESAWAVAAADEASATLAADLTAPWPYGGHVVHRVRVEPEALHAELEVHAADRAMPVTVGWHPWFPRDLRHAGGVATGGRVEVDLPAGGMLLRGPDGIPNGEVARPIPAEPWDDCFVDLARMPAVRWPGALEVTIASDARYWVVFTEREEGVCVEPQTGPPNGLNTADHDVVEPDRPLVATMTISWRRLAD